MEDKFYEKIQKTEEICCSYFNINRQLIMNGDRHSHVAICRGLLFYILHKQYDIPTSVISEYYHCTKRTVFWQCNKVSNLICIYKQYNAMLEEICELLDK